jgi:hypothetical protein
MNNINNLKNMWFIFPVMVYYFFESIVIAIFVSFIWKFVLQSLTTIDITYFQWVCIIWIIKVIFFDVFKLLSGLSTMYNPNNKTNEKQVL